MREIRPSGSEGGAEQTNAPSLPPIKPGGVFVVPHSWGSVAASDPLVGNVAHASRLRSSP